MCAAEAFASVCADHSETRSRRRLTGRWHGARLREDVFFSCFFFLEMVCMSIWDKTVDNDLGVREVSI